MKRDNSEMLMYCSYNVTHLETKQKVYSVASLCYICYTFTYIGYYSFHGHANIGYAKKKIESFVKNCLTAT